VVHLTATSGADRGTPARWGRAGYVRHSRGRLAVLAALGAGLVALLSSDLSALAQEAPWNGAPTKARKAKSERASAVSSKKKLKGDKSPAVVEKSATGPLVLNVSLSRQRLRVYDATGLISESPVSSGRVGYSTPTGVFTVVQKSRMHHSNIYSGAPMPNMQRITWSGIALHAGDLPGYPASHGCIRLPSGYAKKLYGMTTMGTRVIVSRDPVVPTSIASDRLFAAFPPEKALQTGRAGSAGTQVADASGQTVGAVLGVPPAEAADGTRALSPANARRARLLARREVEKAELSKEIRTAGYAKAAADAALQEAARAADATRPAYVEARATADRERVALAKLEAAQTAAGRELADLEAPAVPESGKKRKKHKAMDETKKAARIAEIKAQLEELVRDLEPARSRAQTAADALAAAEAVTKDAEAKRRAAIAQFNQAGTALSEALAKEAAAEKREARRDRPVSVFVSRAKQRLYVRLGWDAIFDTPVTITRPDEPIGTHVFTALAFAPEAAMQWSVVSVPYDPARASKSRKSKAKDAKADPEPKVDLASQTAEAALARIEIPDDVRAEIEDLMKPGSSLVVSDLGLSGETGEYTDFIVPLR